MRPVSSWFVVTVLSCAMALSAPARAQPNEQADAAAVDEEEMVRKFEQAQEHYRQGEFSKAVKVLTELIAMRPEPVLYYNLARAHDGNGDLEDAIASYQRYLELAPDVKDRGAIEKRIETLERQLEEQKRPAPGPSPAPEPPPPPPPSPSVALTVVPWTLVGAGVAGIVAGAVLGGLSRREHTTAKEATVHADGVQAFEAAQDFALGANIAWVAGGVLAAAGVTWLIVDLSLADDETRVGASATWRF